MTFSKNCKTALLALGLLGTSALPSFADGVINISLADKGGMMDMSKNMGFGMGMRMMGKMHMAMMSVIVDKKTVPAGKVTFNVTNVSKDIQHELLVSPIKDENTVLPYVENENRVDEEASAYLGEVSELDPGKSGALTLDLKPGMYILFCNIPGHYTAGMWTTITVQ